MRMIAKVGSGLVAALLLVGCAGNNEAAKPAAMEMGKPAPKVQMLIDKFKLEVVDFEYAKKAIGNGTRKGAKSLLIDARPAKMYAGKTIPSSLNIPDTEFDKYVGQLDKVAKDKEILVYCGGWECGKSPKVAGMLKKKGFTNVKLYQAGEPEWKTMSYPEVGTSVVKAAMNTNGALIIDARPYKKFLGSTIPGSISIPDTEMDKLMGRFPADKMTPVITFCGGYECAKSHIIANKMIEMGYKNVSVYAGGMPAWKEAGLKTTGGGAKPAAAPMVSDKPPFLGPVKKGGDMGSVDGAWFLANYKKMPAGVTIVDVRTADERKAGFIDGTVHVSLEENKPAEFVAKLPKEGYVIFHCAAGGRSMEAFDLVKEQKYEGAARTVYLDAGIKCAGNDCKITPNEPLDPMPW